MSTADNTIPVPALPTATRPGENNMFRDGQSPPRRIGRAYHLTFHHEKLGIALIEGEQPGGSLFPVVASNAGVSTDPEVVSPAQGILKMPREGDFLVEVNGNSVANHEIAVNLIQSTKRPVTLGFCPPQRYSITFSEADRNIDTSAMDCALIH